MLSKSLIIFPVKIIKFFESIFFYTLQSIYLSSRGGLVVELWTDNSLPSAIVGSNLRQVWCIDHSERKLYVAIQIVERRVP